MQNVELYKEKLTQLEALKTERSQWDPHFKELQEYFLPRRGRWLDQAKATGKMNQKLVDPTPRFAVRTLGAGMHSGSTNPALPWLKFTTPDPELMEAPSVATWLYTVESLMRDVFEQSNVYSVLPKLYEEAGVFGTAVMTVLEDPEDVIHCVPSAIGSYFLFTDAKGVVVGKYCEYKMTVQQLVNEYGLTNCSNATQDAFTNKRLQEWRSVLHVIEPRKQRKYGAYDAANMAFRSLYLELNNADSIILRDSGFEENPIACFRWETTEITDAYGNSPGMDALGCSKALQIQQKRKAQAIDKLVDPPMVAPAAMENKPSSLIPGEVTYYGFSATGSAPLFQPAYTIKPETADLNADINETHDLIHQAMYTDLFLAITLADPRQATVPEIVERREEKLLLLGPVLQNHRRGLIEPLVERTFNIMLRQGRLPPPPPELEGQRLRVEMVGMLTQSLKAIQSNGIQQFTGYIASLAKGQADAGREPDIMDKVDWDQAVDEFGLAIGVPPTLIRSDDDVAQMRADRAEQQAAQQQMAAAQPIKDGALAAKALSETQVQGQSALDALTQ